MGQTQTKHKNGERTPGNFFLEHVCAEWKTKFFSGKIYFAFSRFLFPLAKHALREPMRCHEIPSRHDSRICMRRTALDAPLGVWPLLSRRVRRAFYKINKIRRRDCISLPKTLAVPPTRSLFPTFQNTASSPRLPKCPRRSSRSSYRTHKPRQPRRDAYERR
jgi:hypothetical protein